jgi:hypothetical protein
MQFSRFWLVFTSSLASRPVADFIPDFLFYHTVSVATKFILSLLPYAFHDSIS